jgi:hypothetical protein
MPVLDYPTIERVLAAEPPPQLFHYTSPAGLIGIAETRRLWATNAVFLNDRKELVHAIDYVHEVVENRLGTSGSKNLLSDSEKTLLKEMDRHAGAAATGIFVASLTEMGDQLSQWRAYCPPSGGYSIGFPSDQLKSMALAQEYYLTPCVYDHSTQLAIIEELIDHHVKLYRKRIKGKQTCVEVRTDVVWAFQTEVTRYGPILKHPSFSEEREWRLVSSPYSSGDARICYRPGRNSIVPYSEFALYDGGHPVLIRTLLEPQRSLLVTVGPTAADLNAAVFAVTSLFKSCFGMDCWHTVSEVPYRGL